MKLRITSTKGFIWSVMLTFGWFAVWLLYALTCYVANNLE